MKAKKPERSNSSRDTMSGWAGPVITTLGLTAFLTSVALHSYIFSGWGLNFLLIASTGDVISSGLYSAFLIFSGIFAILSGFLCSLSLITVMDKKYKFISNNILILILSFVTVVALYVLDPTVQFQRNVCILFLMGAILYSVVWLMHDVWVDFSSMGKSKTILIPLLFLVFISAAFAVLFCIGSLFDVLESMDENGLAGKYIITVDGCDQGARVLWIGERAIIYACTVGDQREIGVLSHPENATLRQGRPRS